MQYAHRVFIFFLQIKIIEILTIYNILNNWIIFYFKTILRSISVIWKSKK